MFLEKKTFWELNGAKALKWWFLILMVEFSVNDGRKNELTIVKHWHHDMTGVISKSQLNKQRG